jgi:EAL domain-containing protein (putative c-di-GMP-specific phosphodiesterase class I)
MVDIARGMGMKTIAEFVEAPETAAMLHEKGVDYSQGYYHGRPRPVADQFGDNPVEPVVGMPVRPSVSYERRATSQRPTLWTPGR